MGQKRLINKMVSSCRQSYAFLSDFFNISAVVEGCFKDCLERYGNCCELEELVADEVNLYIVSKVIHERYFIDNYLEKHVQGNLLHINYKNVIRQLMNLFSGINYSLTLDDCCDILEGNDLFLQKIDDFIFGEDKSRWKLENTELVDLSRRFIEAYEVFNNCELDINALYRFEFRNFYGNSINKTIIEPGKAIKNEEITDLIIRAQAGDVEARNKLLCKNFGLIYSVAKEYYNECIDIIELIHEGILGFDKAIKNFDLSRGINFSSYLPYGIKNAILRSNSMKKGSIMIKAHDISDLKMYEKMEEAFINIYEKKPSVLEACKMLNWSVARVEHARMLPLEYADLEEAINISDDYDLEEEVIKNKNFFDVDVDFLFDEAKLTDGQREVLFIKFGFVEGIECKRDVEIAKLLGVSHQVINDRVHASLRKLRKTKGVLNLASCFDNSEELKERVKQFRKEKSKKSIH